MTESTAPSALPPRPPLIRDTHLARRAVVYLRQSSDDQVREHAGSTAAQMDQTELPRRWGWPAAAITMNSRDLGLSGTASSNRPGFLELLGEISRGEVGMVVAQAADRLSRKAGDFMHLLDLAQETDTLLCIGGTVYDPASEDAQLLSLQVQGMFGAFDNRLRARRMMEARVAKATRGQAVSPPPTGYVRTAGGEWSKDPDRTVQQAIEQIFDLYPRLGSLSKVVGHFRSQNQDIPRRVNGRLAWGPCDATLIHSVLRNPAYAGDYVFRRRSSKKRAGRVVTRLRARSEWIVFEGHHDPYVPGELWRHIQEMLAARRPHRAPLLGKGHALLQGIVRCNVDGCDRMMRSRYWGRDGMARTASYTCIRQGDWGDAIHRVKFPALFIDRAVAHHVLSVLTAVDRQTALAVLETSELERAAAQRAHRRQVDDANAEVDRLKELLNHLPDDLHHARIDLWRDYNTALERRSALERQASTMPRPAGLTTADVDELIRRTANVHELWHTPKRTHEDRKQLLRAVISEVVLHEVTEHGATIEIVWKSGARDRLPVLRPRGVEAAVKEATLQGENSLAIAQRLNAAGVVTASGRPVSVDVVRHKQGQHGLRVKDERQRARQIIREALLANTPRPEILRELQRVAPRLGPWDPQRLSEAIRQLRRGTRDVDALPSILPAEDEKVRVLAIVDAGLTAGKNWRTIAEELAASGLRPPRGAAFTPVQVRLLYMRSHGLQSFKLSSARTTAEGANA